MVAWSFPIPPLVFPAMAAFLAGEDPSLWSGTPGDISLTLPTIMHGYAWGNTERGWAWVRDEANRYDSGQPPGNVAGRTVSGNITVHGLTNGSYVVEIWNTYAGFKISSATYTSTSGSLTFASGTVDRDIAIKFFATSISPLPPPPPPIPPSGPPVPPPPAPPPGPVPAPSTSDIVITYDGTDITADVAIETATFTMMLGNASGQAFLRVRDDDKTKTFVTGKELTLDIDSQRIWGGYVMTAVRGNWFDVEDSTNIAKVDSYWELNGSDYNILFQKRIAYNKADPTQQLKTYPTGTPDASIIQDIIDNFSDFGLDGIDTSGVVHVGTPNPDKPGVVGNPGDSLGSMMDQITRLTGAVYGITPGKVLFNEDVNTDTAPWVLTDMPGERDVGYRELELLFNGSSLVNDALIWGAGTGSGTTAGTGPVGGANFVRILDQDSIDVHGRWQYGEFTTALYTTNGLTQRASSFVYGSPQSNRGGKDDAISAILTVFVPGYVVGQKATVISNVYSYLDVLPIRQMDVSFVDQSQARYKLYLSQAIDQPWSNYEFYFPPISIPPVTITVPTLPRSGTPYVCISPTLFDSFDRSTSGDFGATSVDGHTWMLGLNSGLTAFGCDFSGSSPVGGFALNNTGVDGGAVSAHLDPVSGEPWTNGSRFQFKITFQVFNKLGATFGITLNGTSCTLSWTADTGSAIVVEDSFSSHEASQAKTDWVLGQDYILEGYADEHVGAGVRVYAPGTPPPSWTSFTYPSGVQVGMDTSCTFQLDASTVPYPSSIFWRDLTFCCSPVSGGDCGITDSFDRPDQIEWGTSDSGLLWGGPTDAPNVHEIVGNVAKYTIDPTTGSFGTYRHLVIPGGVGPVSEAVISGQIVSTTAADSPDDAVFFGADGATDFVEVDFATDGTVFMFTDGPDQSTTLPFTARTPFKMRIKTDGVGTGYCKVWKQSDPEPGTWTLTAPIASELFTDDIYVGAYGDSLAPTKVGVVTTFNDLDAIGLNSCTPLPPLSGTGQSIVMIDDFNNRSFTVFGPGGAVDSGVSSGFGGVPTNIQMQSGESGSSTSVGAGLQVFMATQSAGAGNADGIYVISTDPEPSLAIPQVFLARNSGAPVTIGITFNCPHITDTGDLYSSLLFIITTHGPQELAAHIRVRNDGLGFVACSGDTNVVTAKNDWVAGAEYRLELTEGASQAVAVLYEIGTSNSTTAVAAWNPFNTPDTAVEIAIRGGDHDNAGGFDPPSTVTVTSLYRVYDSLGLTFDDFNRNVTGTGPGTWGATGDWGTASSGAAWVPGASDGLAYVDGSYGRLVTPGASGIPDACEQSMTTTTGITTQDFTFLARVSLFDHVSSDPDTTVDGLAWIIGELAFGYDKVPSPYLYLDDAVGNRYTTPFPLPFWNSLSGFALLRVQRVGGVASIKLWDELQVEPDWMLTGTVSTGGHVGFEEVEMLCDGTTAADVRGALIDYIVLNNVPAGVTGGGGGMTTDCGDSSGGGGGSVNPVTNPTSGNTCETTSTPTDIVTLTNHYVANTTEVFVNGLFKRPSLDYTELDPAAGKIQLNSAPGASASIYVCYTIDSDGGGGGGVKSL